MDTYFAPAARATPEKLGCEIACIQANPLVSGLLKAASGLLAVLNEQRQVLVVNDAFLKQLGIQNPAKVLGLRPGEVLDCVHAHEMAGGCGTSRHCVTCGAAMAIVASLTEGITAERKCVVTIEPGPQPAELCFRVRASTLQMGADRFVLLFLQDVTAAQRWALMERVFLHDISNVVSSLMGTASLLVQFPTVERQDLVLAIHQLSLRLAREVTLQRKLIQDETLSLEPLRQPLEPEKILAELRQQFAQHPAAQDKHLQISNDGAACMVNTDLALVLRVLGNIVLNALEATPAGETVRVDTCVEDRALVFKVWNRTPIPPAEQVRVFEKHFSTKADFGRGLGTYSMKLVGEQILGGQVFFKSTKQDGTTFSFSIPRP